MSSETERITHEFMDRHDLGKLTEHLGRAYVEEGERRDDAGIRPPFANAVNMETAEGANESPLDLSGIS